jgi:putative holliday junction resolvase
MTRIIGLDYGSKRVGVALTNEQGDFALPHSVIQNSKSIVDDVLKICKENNVSKIVIGDSKDSNGIDNNIMNSVRDFIAKFKEKSDIEIVLHPEFFTSVQAEHIQGKNNMIDASAATIILQSFLDTQKNYENSTNN